MALSLTSVAIWPQKKSIFQVGVILREGGELGGGERKRDKEKMEINNR